MVYGPGEHMVAEADVLALKIYVFKFFDLTNSITFAFPKIRGMRDQVCDCSLWYWFSEK